MKTDRPMAFAMRAPDTLQLAFIMESIMEQVATEIHHDPILFKEIHLIGNGDVSSHLLELVLFFITGNVVSQCGNLDSIMEYKEILQLYISYLLKLTITILYLDLRQVYI